jgi:hypothetical protein
MKLQFVSYDKKLQSVTFTFDLLRQALKGFSNAGFRQYIESLRKPKDAHFQRKKEHLAANPELEVDIAKLERRYKRELSAELPVTPNLKWVESKGLAYLWLNTSELVLRVALFEAFLKEIHRHALLDKRKLLARGKRNRSVSLKELFGAGYARFCYKEVQRQVREVDRLSTRERAKFFQDRLSLRWGDDVTVERIDQLTQIRHDLVHCAPDRPVVPKDIEDARKFFRSVADTVFRKACELYPKTFGKK